MVMNFSLEITMKTSLSELPKVKDVYITMLPGNDYKEVANKATELAKSGSFSPEQLTKIASVNILRILIFRIFILSPLFSNLLIKTGM